MKKVLLGVAGILMLGGAMMLMAQPQQGNADASKNDFKAAGHTTADATKDVGHGVAQGAKATGKATKKGAKKTGHAVKKAGDDIAHPDSNQ
jgi:hypothetical protein